jgi:hypothetical protein
MKALDNSEESRCRKQGTGDIKKTYVERKNQVISTIESQREAQAELLKTRLHCTAVKAQSTNLTPCG